MHPNGRTVAGRGLRDCGVGWAERRAERRARRVMRAMDRHIARSARRRPRAGARVAVTALLAAGAVTAGAFAASSLGLDLTDPSSWGKGRAYVAIDGRAVAVPRPAPAQGRVLPAVPVTSSGRYAFVNSDDGVPIGYDPCRPIRYVVRPDGAPAVGTEVVEDAIAQISAATGLSFVDAGSTVEAPALHRTLIQPELYGDGWAPVLVAWSTAVEVPELAGDVAGVGGSAVVPGATGGGHWLAAGRLVLDSTDLGAILALPDGYVQVRAIIMHELAHVVGLDHVDDPTELMNPSTTGILALGPGDRQGLALVGAVACEP